MKLLQRYIFSQAFSPAVLCLSALALLAPILRLGVYALILHLLINLLLQPLSFRQMRAEILSVKTDIASQMVQAGRFVTPAPDLTVYTREILPDTCCD